jgi:hypothetical protein
VHTPVRFVLDPCKGIYYALYDTIHYISLYWVHPLPVRYAVDPWVATVTQGCRDSIAGVLLPSKGIYYALFILHIIYPFVALGCYCNSGWQSYAIEGGLFSIWRFAFLHTPPPSL